MVYYGITDIGLRRVVNQDNFKIKEYPGGVTLAVVCDGMGGANGGATASSVAIETFVKYIDRFGESLSKYSENEPDKASTDPAFSNEEENKTIPEILTSAVASANEAVFSMGKKDPGLFGMGTTLVACIASQKNIYAANVGDSRMYMIDSGGMRQITRDHSYVQHLVDLGRLSPKKAKNARNKNIITRAVGTEESVRPDIFKVDKKILPDSGQITYVLLCTDGLTNMLEASDIAKIIRNSGKPSAESLKSSASELVRRANERGGNDNITVVIMAYK